MVGDLGGLGAAAAAQLVDAGAAGRREEVGPRKPAALAQAACGEGLEDAGEGLAHRVGGVVGVVGDGLGHAPGGGGVAAVELLERGGVPACG